MTLSPESFGAWLRRGPAFAAAALGRQLAESTGATAWLAARWDAGAGMPLAWLAAGGDAEVLDAWERWHDRGQYAEGQARALRERRRALFDGPVVVAGRTDVYGARAVWGDETDVAVVQLNPPARSSVRIELFAPGAIDLVGISEQVRDLSWEPAHPRPEALDRRALDLLRSADALVRDAQAELASAEEAREALKGILREAIMRGDSVDGELRAGVVTVLDPSGLQPPLRRFLEEHLGPTNLARQIEAWRDEVQQSPPSRNTLEIETADGSREVSD